MIELVLAHADLARVRFAHSPIHELVTSLFVLQDPSRRPMYGDWLSSVRPRLDGLQLELLTALAPPSRYLPAFLFPAPAVPRPVLADQLEAVVASPPAMVRAELDRAWEGRPLPSGLLPLYGDPAGHLPAVAEALQRYWEVAVLPVWPRLQAVCTLDLTYRMERFSDGGLARVLADLHPELAMDGERLRIDKPHHCHQVFDLAGTGIVVMPCAFAWPCLLVDCCGVDQPALVYPPRGVAELWEEPSAEQADLLIALVGRTRAVLLATLTCLGPLPSWPASSASARPRSASTSRFSATPPWSAPDAAAARCSTSAPRPPRRCWRPSGPVSKLADRPWIDPRPAPPALLGPMPRFGPGTGSLSGSPFLV